MPRRHPVPTVWLMTDERMGDALWDAVARLPRGAGVVFRHYATPLAERRALFARMAQIAQRRGLVLVRAGGVPLAVREAGVHNARASRMTGRRRWRRGARVRRRSSSRRCSRRGRTAVSMRLARCALRRSGMGSACR
jgi:thiamine-phosphate pyrophosphorylase